MIFGPFSVDKYVFINKPDDQKSNGLWSKKVYLDEKTSIKRFYIDNKYYLKFDDPNTFHSGVEQVYENSLNYKLYINPLKPIYGTSGEYIISSIGDKYMIIKVKKYDENMTSFKGVVVETGDDFPPSIINESDLDIDKKKVLPFIFDTTRGIEKFYYVWALIILSIFSVNIYNYIKIIKIKIDYRKHPIYNKLAFFGDNACIMDQIDSEIQGSQHSKQKTIYTDSWVIWRKLLTIGIYKSSKLNKE